VTGGVLAAAAGVAGGIGIVEGALPGRPQLQRMYGLNGPPGEVPDVEPGPVLSGTFVSRHRLGERTGWALARPPGDHGPLPLVVALHGRGWDHSNPMGPRMGIPQFLAQAVERGVPPFQVATVDGGHTYWHPWPTGEDAGAMVVDEFLPLLHRRYDVPVERVGLMGWSMGGYGALRLGAELGPERVAAVVAASPAVWRDPDDASPTGFSSRQEYEELTVFGDQERLADIPVMVSCGTGDPLYREVEAYVDGFPDDAELTSAFEPGAHDADYWRRLLPAQLAFLGSRVA